MSELKRWLLKNTCSYLLSSSRYLSSSQSNLTQIAPPTNGNKHLLQLPHRLTPISSSNESTDYSSSGAAAHGSSNGTTGVSGSSDASASSPFASPKASRRRGVNSSRCVAGMMYRITSVYVF